MAEIKPFKGITYNKEKISDLKDVTTPPYDVISKEDQKGFYSKSEYNVIRLILGEEKESDDQENNKYTRAASFLKEWLSSGVLKKAENDSIYLYRQDYDLPDGTQNTRTGFVALTKIEDFSSGKVFPHEKTLSGPRSDRLKLMESCHCNLSQIFSLYSDKELAINRLFIAKLSGRRPDMEVTDKENTTHRIFKIDDPETISRVANIMEGKSLFIADGHHRYETALNFRNIMRSRQEIQKDSPYNYVMMYLSNMDDEGMTIFPTHRVLFNFQDKQIDSLKTKMSEYFNVIEFPFNEENEREVRKEFYERLRSEGEKTHAFGMYRAGDDSYTLLVVDDKTKIEAVFNEDMAESLKDLDVTVLHSAVIGHILGISVKAQEDQENQKYIKGSDKAIQLVKDGEFQVAFLMNPTKIEQVQAVATSGNKMPQKSTYFYPKVLTGLVINQLNS